MTSPTGPRSSNSRSGVQGVNRGLTLLELILVMALLTMMAAVVAPRFAGFVEGRKFDGEWDRLLSSLRLARSEAVSRSARVTLRFDLRRGAYGELTGDAGQAGMESLTNARTLPESLTLSFADASSNPIEDSGTGEGAVDVVFLPDGGVTDDSPEYIELRDGEHVKTARKNPVLGYAPPEGDLRQ